MKEGIGLVKYEGFWGFGFFFPHLFYVHMYSLCSLAFWNSLYDVKNINMSCSVVFQHMKQPEIREYCHPYKVILLIKHMPAPRLNKTILTVEN